jgi:putative sigma-54 modulation protein
MKLEIQSIHFDADKKLLDYIEKKLNKLETFYDGIVSGEVFLKLTSEVSGNKLVEVKLNVNNQTLFVKEQSKTFEASCDMAENSMKAQLIKYKERAKSN